MKETPIKSNNGLKIEVGIKIYQTDINGTILNIYTVINITEKLIITNSPSVKFRINSFEETGNLIENSYRKSFEFTFFDIETTELKERKIKQDLDNHNRFIK